MNRISLYDIMNSLLCDCMTLSGLGLFGQIGPVVDDIEVQ